MNTYSKPELLAPAGNLEKLKIAYHYGADAVYIGGTVFGLRKYAENFSIPQLEEASKIAKSLNKTLYVVLNGYAHQSDLKDIAQYLVEISHIPIDAFIISDAGVAALARQHHSAEIHVSTQASVTNAYGCNLWKSLGATRVVLAREVTLEETEAIQKHSDVELEIFVHGAMCASYSGKCTISNYTVGRDSNRGGCIQSCRHLYTLEDDSGETESTQIMNAKDLQAIRQLPHIMSLGIDSIKVEGRMKSNLYVANTISTYRRCLDELYDLLTSNTPIPETFFQPFEDQLATVSNRTFSSGGLENRPAGESINYAFNGYEKQVDFVGTVKAIQGKEVFVEVRNTFYENDDLIALKPTGETQSLSQALLRNLSGEPINSSRPNMMMTIEGDLNLSPMDLIVKRL